MGIQTTGSCAAIVLVGPKTPGGPGQGSALALRLALALPVAVVVAHHDDSSVIVYHDAATGAVA
jgi:hypothetical protein